MPKPATLHRLTHGEQERDISNEQFNFLRWIHRADQSRFDYRDTRSFYLQMCRITGEAPRPPIPLHLQERHNAARRHPRGA